MKQITEEFVNHICSLYGNYYDDTEEDSSIGGESWEPGKAAEHKSLRKFKEELEEAGIHLSTSKIRKILISGGRYSTELSRSVSREYERYQNIEKVAEVLDISPSTVYTYLPYERMAYKLDERSDNAKSLQRRREKEKAERDSRESEKIKEIMKKIGDVLTVEEIQVITKAPPERIKVYLEMMKGDMTAQKPTEETRMEKTDQKPKKTIKMEYVNTNDEEQAKEFLDYYNIEWKMRKSRDFGKEMLVAAVPSISKIRDEIRECRDYPFCDHLQVFKDRDGNAVLVMNPYMEKETAEEEVKKYHGLEVAPYSLYGLFTPSVVRKVHL